MSLQIRRGTAAELANITPVVGELIYTTDTQEVFVGDGSTAGGIAVTDGSSYGNANVATYLPTYTGNISGGNLAISGLISANGNVTIDSSNGAWRFDTSGNLALPEDTTISTSAGNITLVPDGDGTVFVEGNANVLLHLRGINANSMNTLQIDTWGNALANADNGATQGGHFSGTYRRDSGPVIQGDVLSGLYGFGSVDGSTLVSEHKVGVILAAANTWTANTTATHISFYVTPGTTSVPERAMQLNSNGNLQLYTGDFNVANGNVTSDSIYCGGLPVTGIDALYAGIDGYTPLLSNVVAQFTANANSYSQINFQNINDGAYSSSDFVATADDGDNDNFYVNMGIGSSTFSNPDYTAYGPHDGYLLTDGGNLILNVESSGKEIKFVLGGYLTENVIATMSETDFNMTGNITSTTIKTTPVTFSALPAAGTIGAGARAFITDANTVTFGSQVSGSAANSIPVYSDGTNWYVG